MSTLMKGVHKQNSEYPEKGYGECIDRKGLRD